ncbi:MAG: hypothetical protein Q9195_004882 [Heterodermia aff. obscurata]
MQANSKATPMTSNAGEVPSQDPLRLMILPEGDSTNSRIITLSHPRTSKPCRYYFCPEKGLYEFTRIAAPKSAHQSWLLGPATSKIESSQPNEDGHEQPQNDSVLASNSSPQVDNQASRPVSDGYVIQSPELLIATPIDLLFLVLPPLYAKSMAKSSSGKGLFLSADDILEPYEETSKHFAAISSHERYRQMIETRMSKICETVEAGDETMFRLDVRKLLAELLMKAQNMVELGLPASMETKFVRRTLDRPVMAVKREESSKSESLKVSTDESEVLSPHIDNVDSQASTTTSLSTDSNVSAVTEVTHPPQDEEGLSDTPNHHLLRLRVALSYMMAAYVARPLESELKTLLAAPDSPLDFKPLDEELAIIARMRSEALAARSASDFSRKRTADDDEAAALRLEKKAKKEEDEKKKKAGETRGIRDLKKADTTGMKKMSDFFGKASAGKKKS